MLTELVLHDIGINSIPQGIANLTKLTHLDLSYNMLSGNIPLTLQNLNQLTFLNLHDNKLTGQIREAITKICMIIS